MNEIYFLLLGFGTIDEKWKDGKIIESEIVNQVISFC